MRWTVHGERSLYDSDWVRLHLADVEVPGSRRFEHHVVRMPAHAAGAVVHDEERGLLLLWRHRFITDSWGWEVPAGRIDSGETPVEAARREVEEATGWRPLDVRPLVSYYAANGVSDLTFHLFAAEGAEYVGEPTDLSEAERVTWLPPTDVRELVMTGGMPDGLRLTALLFAMARGLV
jgi:8-oxo-dGTP pyrophosphatase MutT (NUDIX family)